MRDGDELDRRFGLLKQALDARPAIGPVHAADGDSYTEAAVSLVVRAARELELLLIKRTVSARDPWSGHMALPGGRRDPTDPSLLDTAVRETLEETGVRLQAPEHHLGRLEIVTPQGPTLPRIRIAPFVFGVPGGVPAVANPNEVEAVHWVPLSLILDPGATEVVDIPIRGSVRSFPAILVEGEVVWGLTYRILSQLIELLPPSLAAEDGSL